MAEVRQSSEARLDLVAIALYLGERNAGAAFRFLDTVDAKLWLLASHPELGEFRPDLAQDLRSFTVGSYVIYYRPVPQGIEVARVLHSARDVDAQF